MSDLKDSLVKTSNALTRAPWRGLSSVWAPRIIAAVTSRVHEDDPDFKEYEVNMLDFVRLSRDGKNAPTKLSGHVVKDIDAAIKQLLNTLITYEDRDERGKRYKAYFNVFYFCQYFPEDGVIRASFAPQMKQSFLNLKSYFTLYPLSEFLGLRSMYSQKLYEFLSSWHDKPYIRVSLDQLSDVLDVSPTIRKSYSQMKRAVLDYAEREINGKTSLHYTWEPIKTGRKVTAILFRFGECRTGDVDTELSSYLTNKAQNDEHNKWQRLSNACFERHFKRCEVCKPNNGRKCDFCQTRGRLLGGRTPAEAFKAAHEAHRRMVAAGLEPPPEKTKRRP